MKEEDNPKTQALVEFTMLAIIGFEEVGE